MSAGRQLDASRLTQPSSPAAFSILAASFGSTVDFPRCPAVRAAHCPKRREHFFGDDGCDWPIPAACLASGRCRAAESSRASSLPIQEGVGYPFPRWPARALLPLRERGNALQPRKEESRPSFGSAVNVGATFPPRSRASLGVASAQNMTQPPGSDPHFRNLAHSQGADLARTGRVTGDSKRDRELASDRGSTIAS